MRIFIAEKPSVARVIAQSLGSPQKNAGFLTCGTGDVVTWCFGHMLEPAEPEKYLPDGHSKWMEEDLPIIPGRTNPRTGFAAPNWQWIAKKESSQQLRVIKALLKEKKAELVNCGDPDNEGQLLVDEVMQHCGRNPYGSDVMRYWASAQDAASVKKGLSDLKPNKAFKGMADAARARQEADWLLGMNLSRAYTLANSRNGGDALVAAGRVQTPTLALIVLRDREIGGFTPVDYFRVEAVCRFDEKSVNAFWMPNPDQVPLDSEGRLRKQAVADLVASKVEGAAGLASGFEKTDKRRKPPKCFSLADITAYASAKWGMTAQEVLDGCQALYDAQLTTYPRTDCPYLPEDQHAEAPDVLKAVAAGVPALAGIIKAADPSVKSPVWDNSKITAHHAIIPTRQKADLEKLDPKHRHIYEAVCRQYIAQFLPDYVYEAAVLEITIAAQRFQAKGIRVKQKGWTEVIGRPAAGKDEEAASEIPDVKEGDACTCESANTVSAKTKPPAAFTEGTLIKAMENISAFMDLFEKDPEKLRTLRRILKEGDGIGTSATRAEIINRLKEKKYIETKGKKLASTELGRAVIDAVPDLVKSPGLTAIFEKMLQEVAVGKRTDTDFVSRQIAFVENEVKRVREDRTFRVGGAKQPRPGVRFTWGRRSPAQGVQKTGRGR